MKRVLLPVLAIASLATNSFALSGGPVYPVDTSTSQAGTYQAVLRGENFMGITSFGVTGTTTDSQSANNTTAGLSVIFCEGLVSSGYSFGVGGPASSKLTCFFEASRTRLGPVNASFTQNAGTPEETTTTYFVNDALYFSGSYDADMEKGVVFANFSGEGTVEFSQVSNIDGGTNVNGTIETSAAPELVKTTIDYTVYGSRVSVSTTAYSGFNTLDQPSLIVLQ